MTKLEENEEKQQIIKREFIRLFATKLFDLNFMALLDKGLAEILVKNFMNVMP